MRGEQWLKKTGQYALVHREGRSWVNRAVVVRVLANDLELSRFGFSISRRVGNAVVRNKFRRMLREIARAAPVKPGWDIVFIVRPAANMDYNSLKEAVISSLKRAGVLNTGFKSKDNNRVEQSA